MTDNLPAVTSALKKWETRMDKAAQMAANNIGREVWTRAKNITHEQTHNPKEPRRNAPSGGPNYVTGNLNRNIIQAPTVRMGFGTYIASVDSNAEYSRALEDGSSKWTSGVKYPFMRPARDQVVMTGLARTILIGYVRAAMMGA